MYSEKVHNHQHRAIRPPHSQSSRTLLGLSHCRIFDEWEISTLGSIADDSVVLERSVIEMKQYNVAIRLIDKRPENVDNFDFVMSSDDMLQLGKPQHSWENRAIVSAKHFE